MLTLLSANLLYVVTFGKMILVSWDIFLFSHFFKMSLLKFPPGCLATSPIDAAGKAECSVFIMCGKS